MHAVVVGWPRQLSISYGTSQKSIIEVEITTRASVGVQVTRPQESERRYKCAKYRLKVLELGWNNGSCDAMQRAAWYN